MVEMKTAKRPTGKRSTGVIGVRGLKNLAGRINEEYLAALKSWTKEAKIYQEMRDDAVISTLLDAIKLPLLAAEFEVVKQGDTEADDMAAEFLEENMWGMARQSWRAHVGDALESLDFGFVVSEVVLEKRTDGRLWLANLEPRAQETLYRWDFDEQDGATAFAQLDPDTGKQLIIPLEKCVHVALGGRKGNPQGRSLLRSIYRTWRYLRNLEELEAIGIERDVGGMPIFKLPEGGITDAEETALKAAAKGLKQDEEAYLLLPFGVEVIPYASGSKAYNIAEVIERKKKEILMRGFAQFLMLGMEKVGSQALVQGSQDFFALALVGIQQQLLEVWNQQLVPYLFSHNSFPGLTALPQITWADPGKPDIGALLDAYAKGQGASVITPIREDEEHVRGMLRLPDLPEGEGEGPRLPRGTAPPIGLF